MVEARGVEPLSENVTGEETTCLVEFLPWAFTPQRSSLELRTDKTCERLACGSRPELPDIESETSLLCDVLPRPADKAAEDGYLKIKQRMPFQCWQLLFCTRSRVRAPRHASWPQSFPSKP